MSYYRFYLIGNITSVKDDTEVKKVGIRYDSGTVDLKSLMFDVTLKGSDILCNEVKKGTQYYL